MELERPRRMELLYTPRSELAKMMKENSILPEELIFLFSSNKITPAEIRMNAPLLNDKLLMLLLKHWVSTMEAVDPRTAERDERTNEGRDKTIESYNERSRTSEKMPQQVIA